MSKVKSIKQVTNNRFLNYFQMEAQARDGHVFPYYMASRSTDLEHLRMNFPEKAPDGVAVFAVHGKAHDKVVLIRQFRFPLGGYIYEFPAGLVEQGESYFETAVRELREETGLNLIPVVADPLFERGYYTTIGMTDENCAMVYGYCDGEPSLSGLESTEELQVVLADRAMVKEILRKENVALNCAYMLTRFLDEGEDPLAFLNRPMVFESHSAAETLAIGEELAIQAFPGQVWTLSGELGAGKTVFTQGFAKGLGLTEAVSSPTFTILQIYEEGRLPMYHFDLYRIGDPEELFEIGCEEYFYGKGISLVEWPEMGGDELPAERIEVTIEKDPEKGFDYRRITVVNRRQERI